MATSNKFETLKGANNVQIMDTGTEIVLKIRKDGNYGKTVNKSGVSNYEIIGNTQGRGYVQIGNDLEVSVFLGKRITPRKDATPAPVSAPTPTPEKALETLIAEQVALAVAAALAKSARK